MIEALQVIRRIERLLRTCSSRIFLCSSSRLPCFEDASSNECLTSSSLNHSLYIGISKDQKSLHITKIVLTRVKILHIPFILKKLVSLEFIHPVKDTMIIWMYNCHKSFNTQLQRQLVNYTPVLFRTWLR